MSLFCKSNKNFILSKPGDRSRFESASDFVREDSYYWSATPGKYPRQKLGHLHVISPPNFDCFFNSLLGVTKLFALPDSTVQDQFITLTVRFKQYASKFITQQAMDGLVSRLPISVLSQVQLRTMEKNRALKRVDLTKPTLVTLSGVDCGMSPQYGHVGYVQPTQKTRCLHYQEIMTALNGQAVNRILPKKQFTKKSSAHGPKVLVQETKPQGQKDRSRFFYNLRVALKQTQLSDKTSDLQNQKDWAYYMLATKTFKLSATMPTEIASTTSALIISSYFKGDFPNVWDRLGVKPLNTFKLGVKYGCVLPQTGHSVFTALVAVLVFCSLAATSLDVQFFKGFVDRQNINFSRVQPVIVVQKQKMPVVADNYTSGRTESVMDGYFSPKNFSVLWGRHCYVLQNSTAPPQCQYVHYVQRYGFQKAIRYTATTLGQAFDGMWDLSVSSWHIATNVTAFVKVATLLSASPIYAAYLAVDSYFRPAVLVQNQSWFQFFFIVSPVVTYSGTVECSSEPLLFAEPWLSFLSRHCCIVYNIVWECLLVPLQLLFLSSMKVIGWLWFLVLCRTLINSFLGGVVIVGFVPRLINSAATQRFSVAALLGAHAKQALKSKTQTNKFGGIKVVGSQYGKKVVHSPVGILDPGFNKMLNAYGKGFSQTQLNQSIHLSGGHANMRASVDSLQTDAIERVCSRILQSSNTTHDFHIVDVGAKFSKISRIINQRFTLRAEDMMRIKKEQVLTGIIGDDGLRAFNTAHRAACNVFNNTAGLYDSQANFLAAHAILVAAVFIVPRVIPVQMTLISGCDVMDAALVAKYARVIGRVRYVPVRPRVTDYDVNYYAKQLEAYMQMSAQPSPVRFAAPFMDTIQAFQDSFLPLHLQGACRETRFYLVFDCHYYLAGWTPKSPGRVLLVGGDFCSQLGTYNLPLFQGSYKVFAGQNHKAWMTMTCSSSQTSYSHPLVHVNNADLRMDYGWYAHVMHDCASQTLRIRSIVLPDLPFATRATMSSKSVQAEWMTRQITALQKASKSTPSSASQKAEWKKYLGVTSQSGVFTCVQEAREYAFLCHDFSERDQVTLCRHRGNIDPISSLIVDVMLFFVRLLIKPISWLIGRGIDIRIGVLESVAATERSVHQGVITEFKQLNQRQFQQIRFGYVSQVDIQMQSRAGHRLSEQEVVECFNVDVPKVKAKKCAQVTFHNKFAEQKATFFTKPIPKVEYVSEHLIPNNQESRQASRGTVDRCNRYIAEHPNDATNWKGELVDREMMSVCTKTGYSFVKDVHEFQWSSKSVLNAIYAMYHRHLSCHLQPDMRIIPQFMEMTDRLFSKVAHDVNEALVRQPQFDPIQYVRGKTEFARAKKQLYYKKIVQLLQAGCLGPSAFMTMVKSGQVYYTSELNVDGSFLHGQDSRPRNIMTPCQSLCGLLTCIQSKLWKPLKKVLPSFVQGLTKDQMIKLFQNGLGDGWMALSLDGSSFDSTQNASCMAAVDDKFFDMIRPGLRAVLQSLKDQKPGLFLSQVDTVLDFLLSQAKNPVNVCFTNLPNISPAAWPEHIWKLWTATYAKKVFRGQDRQFVESNYIFNQILGTTFSGHPTKTTLGNTLRSISYAYFYLERAGFRNPWDSKDVKVYASGDDVVIFCRKGLEDVIRNAILQWTSRDADGVVGLGQRIKTVAVSLWHQFDFCSKWAFGGLAEDMDLCRDVDKLLNTRQYYSKQNKHILQHPGLHALAILTGFKTEKVSHLVQDILQIRLSMYGLPKDHQKYELTAISDKYKYTFGGKTGYRYESQVNVRCGINFSTLYELMDSKRLSCQTSVNKSGKQVLYGYVQSPKCHSSIDLNRLMVLVFEHVQKFSEIFCVSREGLQMCDYTHSTGCVKKIVRSVCARQPFNKVESRSTPYLVKSCSVRYSFLPSASVKSKIKARILWSQRSTGGKTLTVIFSIELSVISEDNSGQ